EANTKTIECVSDVVESSVTDDEGSDPPIERISPRAITIFLRDEPRSSIDQVADGGFIGTEAPEGSSRLCVPVVVQLGIRAFSHNTHQLCGHDYRSECVIHLRSQKNSI